MTAVDMTYERELAPYQDFALPDSEVWQAKYREVQVLRMRVLLLNGPAHSGKSHIAKHIKSLAGEQCVTVSMPETLYAMMGECGLPNCHLPYAEFKALPWGRRALIDSASRIKRDDLTIICRFAMNKAQAEHPRCQLVVLDNVGFYYEVEWFNDHYFPDPILLRVITPFSLRNNVEQIVAYRDIYVKHLRWPNDSRSSLTGDGPQITASDSALACELVSRYVGDTQLGSDLNDIHFGFDPEDIWGRLARWIIACASYPSSNPELPFWLDDLDSGAEPTTKD